MTLIIDLINDKVKQVLRNHQLINHQTQNNPQQRRTYCLLGPAQYSPEYLDALPKKIKELNAEPYLFVFESMLRSRELIDPALSSLAVPHF